MKPETEFCEDGKSSLHTLSPEQRAHRLSSNIQPVPQAIAPWHIFTYIYLYRYIDTFI